MSPMVKVTVITGPHRGKKFCLRGPLCGTVGRAPDCFVQLSGTERDWVISRHHCKLEVAGPSIRVKDLGSSHGTYINGAQVRAGSPPDRETAGCPEPDGPAATLQDGDILTVAGTSLKVEVVDCAPDRTK